MRLSRQLALPYLAVLAPIFATMAVAGLAATAAPPRAIKVVVPPISDAEQFPGGAATSKASTTNANAFSSSSGNLSFEKEFDFKIGNALFRKFWVSAPSSTKTSDGLGPLYNARSCQGCHLKDGRGHPPTLQDQQAGAEAVSLLMRLSVPPQTDVDREMLASGRASVIADPVYGGQLQPFALQGQISEGKVVIDYREEPVTFADGTTAVLRRPSYTITDLGFGPLHDGIMLSPRVAPQMIGLGLLEAVPEADIVAGADPDDRNQDGISGRVNRVWSRETNALALGRFGWKAGTPSLRQQAGDAFVHDIGISSRLFPQPAGDCTAAQTSCRGAPNGAPKASPTIEISDNLFDLVTFYSANLAVPPRRMTDATAINRGRSVFHQAKCAGCHTPSFKTGASPAMAHFAQQTIWPYTDMLLHDMGEGLADHRPEAGADGREWRTPPLWGIGLTETVSGHTFFLHDGRARNVTEAILWHGGEAEASREVFKTMNKSDRDALIAFVNSL